MCQTPQMSTTALAHLVGLNLDCTHADNDGSVNSLKKDRLMCYYFPFVEQHFMKQGLMTKTSVLVKCHGWRIPGILSVVKDKPAGYSSWSQGPRVDIETSFA